MDPLQSTTGLRWLPTPAHEKAEESTLSGPPKDRTTIGGLKMRKRTEAPVAAPAPAPAPPTPRQTEPRVAACLNTLVDCGLKFTKSVDQNIEKAFKDKHEALVRVGAPYTMVASFANIEEMELYARLHKGEEPAGSPHDVTRSKLLELDQKGLSFYFARDTGPLMGKLPVPGPTAWLRTDAAGAAILLARGESLRILGADGSEQKVESAPQLDSVQTAGSEQKKDVRHLLDFLEGLGTRVEADYPLPETMLASDYEQQYWTQQKKLLTSGFTERPQSSDFLARGKMLRDLAEGGEINLTLPGQTRPIPIDRHQGELIQRFLKDAHPPEFDFTEAYNKLKDRGAKVFVRQLHGDARGQLVESKTHLASYLNLAVGGECVILESDGDLKSVTDLQSFSMAGLKQTKNPEADAFMARYAALKEAGFVFFKPGNVNAQGQFENWSTPGAVMLLKELSEPRAQTRPAA